MTQDLLRKVTEFKKLNNKRAGSELTVAEAERWAKLSQELGDVLGKRPGASSEPAPAVESVYTRQALRVATELVVHFEDGAHLKQALVKNISGGGLYIETSQRLPSGAELEIRIDVGAPKKSIAMRVKVVWVNSLPSRQSGLNPGVGVKFLDLDTERRTAIAELVHDSLDNVFGATAPKK